MRPTGPRAPQAVCNDGSPGAYYFRKASDTALENVWLLYLEAREYLAQPGFGFLWPQLTAACPRSCEPDRAISQLPVVALRVGTGATVKAAARRAGA